MAGTCRSDWIAVFEEGLEPSAAARRSAARTAARSRAARYYGREATARVPLIELDVGQSSSLPELEVVRRRRPRRGAVAVVVLLAALLLGLGVVCPVLIGSAATELEATAGRLEAQQKDLAAEASALSAKVSALSAPKRVAEQAAGLGMQPATSIHYLEVAAICGVVEGDTTVAGR